MSRDYSHRDNGRISDDNNPDVDSAITLRRRWAVNSEINYRTLEERVLSGVDEIERYYGYDR